MTSLLSSLDLWVVAIYLAGMLLVGWRVSAGSRDVEGYTVGNRSMKGWVIGISVLGTFLSSITFLAIPAKTYEGNWNAYVFSLALVPAAWVAGRWFVPLYRTQVQLSAYEFLHQRFGLWARVYAVLSYIVLQLIRVATVLLLVAFPVHKLLGWEITPTLVLLGALVIIYDTLGGIRAVIWTDVCQVAVLLLGALGCLASLLFSWPTGPAGLLAAIPHEKVSLGEPASWNLGESTILVVFLYGLAENLRNYGTDQNYVQRMLASESRREAAKAIWIGALSYMPIAVLFCLIGTSLFMHDQALPRMSGQDAPVAAQRVAADEVFPNYIRDRLPPPLSGLVIAAIMAAAMSTIDSSLNSMSTVVLVDIVRPLRRREPRLPEIYTLRSATVLLGVLGTGTAVGLFRIYREQAATIMDLWWEYAGTAGGGLFGLFLLAWLLPKVPSWAAALGVLTTLPVLTWGTFFRDLPTTSPWVRLDCPLHPYLVGVSGTAALFAVGLLFWGLVKLGWLQPNPRAAGQPPRPGQSSD